VLEAPNAGVLEVPNAVEDPPNDGAALLDPNVELPKIGEDDPNAFEVPNEDVAGDGDGVSDFSGVESEAGFNPNRDVLLDDGADELAP
jgi:hypothetical protein